MVWDWQIWPKIASLIVDFSRVGRGKATSLLSYKTGMVIVCVMGVVSCMGFDWFFGSFPK